MPSNEIIVEVSVDSTESAVAAERGGARRVELCASLMDGGITPSAGLIATVRQKVSIGLHVMIRPRAGDFYYTPDEFDAMRRDVLMAKDLGADGVVFGILDANANIDVQRTRALVDLAKPLSTTYHRAFDMSADLLRSLQRVEECGADRILTSGGAPTAIEGTATLRRLVEAAKGHVIVMACGGIDHKNVQVVIEGASVREIHVGLRTPITSPMRHRNASISMGPSRRNEYQRFVVLERNVAQLVRAASARNL
ncbi:MAG: copper homeostasis protein CutC [Terriglobales bacterium]